VGAHSAKLRVVEGVYYNGFAISIYSLAVPTPVIILVQPSFSCSLVPNGAKTQLLMHTNTNYLLDLYILLGLFDRGY
jgi:hypothetical protein